MGRLLAVCTILGLLVAASASADQPKDFFARRPDMGTFMFVDLVFPAGLQLTVEQRRPIHGISNQLTLRGAARVVWPYAQAQADVEFRVLYVTFGLGAGYHMGYRDYRFQSGERGTRDDRKERDHQGRWARRPVAFGEARLALTLPFGDHVALASTLRGRLEDRPQRSFDWLLTMVHDGGPLLVHDNLLLFHGDSWGGVGLQAQWVLYRQGGDAKVQLNPGVLFATRPGYRWRNDLFLISLLTHLPDDRIYGNHQLGVPINIVMAYRTILEL